VIAPDSLPRVLHRASGRPLTLVQHDEAFGPMPRTAPSLDLLEASGLTGRGGAAFPTARKARLIGDQRGHTKFMVVNAMEGEPAAHKDRTLISTNPHLVLDGAQYLAGIIGARHVAVCVSRDDPIMVNHLQRAVHERDRHSARGVNFELHTPPWRYVAGEESALIHWLDDNESLPQYRPRRPHVLRIGHAPALVDNAETCAHVGLIARYGSDWFRRLGTPTSPGTALVSISGAVARPTVLEVALGVPVRTIIERAGADPDPQALLMGGYGGAWLDARHLDVAYSADALAPLGSSVGAGVIIVLPRTGCGIVETFRIARWMANESARQCGPCAFGLPAIAEDLARLVAGDSAGAGAAYDRLVDRCGAIEGRGACRHPDGVVRLVRSALRVFADHVEDHVRGRACAASRSNHHYSAVPTLEREEELIWE